MKKIFGTIVILSLALASCKKENESEQPAPVEPGTTDYSQGYFVSNEGNFGSSNSSITYISEAGVVISDVYFLENEVQLGDVLQSFSVIDNKGYAVLNNSQKIEVITMADMKNAGTITGFDYPRYLVDGGNGKAYVSDGSMAGNVRVIDLATNAIVSSIPVGNGPEKMLLHDDLLFVCNSGGWSLDNTVSVIDITTNSIVQTITVSDRPQDIVQDAAGDVWVICSGETIYDMDWNVVGNTDAKIYRINPDTFMVEDEQTIGANGDHPRQLAISNDGQNIYFENNGVFTFSITAMDFDGAEIIAESKGSLDVNPATGELWCASVSDFVNASSVYKYSSTGTLLSTFTAGIGTSSVAFN